MNMELFQCIEISSSPQGLEIEYNNIFSKDALMFLFQLVSEFQPRVTEILRQRKIRKLNLETSGFPDFIETSSEGWSIDPVPDRLQNRQLDLGDIAPSDTELLKKALLTNSVQGIQVDFDDGSCPSWGNQLKGIHNIIAIVNGKFFPDEIPTDTKNIPLLLLRPRAWNMFDHNLIMNGQEIPGALMDFGLLYYHIGKELYKNGAGPYFYLPKLENASEAKLWNDIFKWAEKQLNLPQGVIKACVLIENIFAAFEADNILFELRHHSFGLNCGIWDYSASIINKFGANKNFILPDRNKYVSIDQPFLCNYVKWVISVCKKRKAPVTGGMIPYVLESFSATEKNKVLLNILKTKRKELKMGVDGFLTYDVETVQFLQNSLFSKDDSDLVVHTEINNDKISNTDLLNVSHGGVTLAGLMKNIKVSIFFIYYWISEGKGHFVLDGAVEDSATAEISRLQVWQWIFHQVLLEDDSKEKITKSLVSQLVWKTYAELINCQDNKSFNTDHLEWACDIFLELVTAYDAAEFMTTYLYNHSVFRKFQNT